MPDRAKNSRARLTLHHGRLVTPAAALLWAICLATLLAFPLIRGFPTPRLVRRRVAECLVIGFALVASIAWFVVVVVTW